MYVDRPAYSQKHMHERFQYEDAVLSTPNRRKAVATIRKVWNELTLVDIIYCIFPIFDWYAKGPFRLHDSTM